MSDPLEVIFNDFSMALQRLCCPEIPISERVETHQLVDLGGSRSDRGPKA